MCTGSEAVGVVSVLWGNLKVTQYNAVVGNESKTVSASQTTAVKVPLSKTPISQLLQ